MRCLCSHLFAAINQASFCCRLLCLRLTQSAERYGRYDAAILKCITFGNCSLRSNVSTRVKPHTVKHNQLRRHKPHKPNHQHAKLVSRLWFVARISSCKLGLAAGRDSAACSSLDQPTTARAGTSKRSSNPPQSITAHLNNTTTHHQSHIHLSLSHPPNSTPTHRKSLTTCG